MSGAFGLLTSALFSTLNLAKLLAEYQLYVEEFNFLKIPQEFQL